MTTTPSGAEAHFRAVAPKYMRQFMADFDLEDIDAAAVFGNLGYESLGFTKLQEIKPVVKGSRGGYGWAQWTADRRVVFEAYCKRNKLDPASHDANYAFLFVELTGSEKAALAKLKAAKTLDTKTVAFEKAFERAGVKNYPKRKQWAAIALNALRADSAALEPRPVPPAPTTPAEPETPTTGQETAPVINWGKVGAVIAAVALLVAAFAYF